MFIWCFSYALRQTMSKFMLTPFLSIFSLKLQWSIAIIAIVFPLLLNTFYNLLFPW